VVGDTDKEALLIYIVRIALVNPVFLYLGVQQVEVQLVFMLAVG
jgi:hypothetical protein